MKERKEKERKNEQTNYTMSSVITINCFRKLSVFLLLRDIIAKFLISLVHEHSLKCEKFSLLAKHQPSGSFILLLLRRMQDITTLVFITANPVTSRMRIL